LIGRALPEKSLCCTPMEFLLDKTSSCAQGVYNFRSIYLVLRLGYIGAPSGKPEGSGPLGAATPNGPEHHRNF
jgi:hypothetical protein